MLDNKHINKIIVILTIAAILVLYICMFATVDTASAGITMEYESALFDTSEIITINIEIDEDQWQDLLDNATSEEYYACNVTVNGVTYENVGIRAKGNTSLSMVASSDSDRYSFKIKFDEYVDGQNCNGLTKLVLNNNYSDATMMKEAICYDMFQFLGADASLYNYASISVNGEYTGVYLALEPVEEEFALRNYGLGYGNLYKPDSSNMGGAGNMQNFDISDVREFLGLDSTSDGDSDDESESVAEFGQWDTDDMQMSGGGQMSAMDMADMADMADMSGFDVSSFDMSDFDMSDFDMSDFDMSDIDMSQMPDMSDMDIAGGGMANMGGGGAMGGDSFSISGGGAELNYIDDQLDSYADIWESSVFTSTDEDHYRIVEALEAICSDDVTTETLAEYLDIDNILKYMAVHTFVVNLDSLSGDMAHNYYLYEEDGKLNLIPWDYNLSFGGFQSGSASDMINFPIDTPFSDSIDLEDRQFFMAILENETYLAQYHEYLQQLVDEYVYGGQLEATYNNIRSQIDELVASDPTSFYTYDEYDAAAQMLLETIQLRADSVAGQLDGTIPSTSDGQSEDSSTLIDASSIDLSVMGVQGGDDNMGGGGGGMDKGGFANSQDSFAIDDDFDPAESGDMAESDSIDLDENIDSQESLEMPDTTITPNASGSSGDSGSQGTMDMSGDVGSQSDSAIPGDMDNQSASAMPSDVGSQDLGEMPNNMGSSPPS